MQKLVRRRVDTEDPELFLDVIAPPDIRKSRPVPLPGETEAERKRREELFFAILDASGH